MTDKPFSPSTNTPFKVENYYMQLVLTKLTCKRPQPSEDYKYCLSIFKGTREFDTTKTITIPSNCHGELPLKKGKLSFMVDSYNPEGTNSFRLVIVQVIRKGHVKEVGEFMFNANQYIDQFNISQNGAFQVSFDMNEEFKFQAEFYVDKNQYGLARLIQDTKNPQVVKEDLQPPRVMRQRIIDARREMDQHEERAKGSKEKKFTKFSPRREVSADKKQAEIFSPRKTGEERKYGEKQVLGKVEEDEKKKVARKKGQEVVIKKEWIIPGAEEITRKMEEAKKRVKRKTSNENIEEKTKASDSKVSQKSKEKSVEQEPSLMDKLPISPRVLIPLLVILVAALGYFLFMGPAAQLAESEPLAKGKKGPRAAEKERKKGKAKSKK